MAAGPTQKNLPPLWMVRADGTAELSTAAFFRPSIVARLRTVPTVYDARLWLELTRPDLGPDVALVPASGWTHARRGFRIDAVVPPPNLTSDEDSRDATVLLVDTRALSLSSMLRLWAERDAWFQERPAADRHGYMLLNRARGECTWAFADGESKTREVIVAGVRIRWMALAARAPLLVRNGKWGSEPSWMSGVTLGNVTVRQVSVVVRDVKVESFLVTK